MSNKIIYLLIFSCVLYNTFFDSFDEKQEAINKVKSFLELSVSEDTKCIEFRSNINDKFIIWSTLSSNQKNIDRSVDELVNLGWKKQEIKNNKNTSTYEFKKNSNIYVICDYRDSNIWEENVHAK